MKTATSILFSTVLSLVFIATSNAQERVTVPLSNPGQPGKLEVGIVRGSIEVTGFNGQEVIISYNGSDNDDNEDSGPTMKNGLRRISDNSVGFQVEENDNKVEISGTSPQRSVNFEVSVPRNFSLSLSTVDGGHIKVENVNGEMEISNVNGDVTLTNIAGSAVVNTVNGDITASFNGVGDNQPMAFSNLNGDIDVTLPARVKASAKMKSEWGEVYTDFDMEISKTNQENVDVDSDVYKVSVNNWITGIINGGGPEYLFKSMRGDIYIRKQ